MNPRQRRLRRQRRKARVHDAEEARLELVELKRKADSVARQTDRSRERQNGVLAQNITASEIARVKPPKPSGGALLAAMLKGEKA